MAAGSFVFLACFLCVREMDTLMLWSEPAQVLRLELRNLEEKAEKMEAECGVNMTCRADNGKKVMGIGNVAVSGQRIIEFALLEHNYVYDLSDNDLDVLMRIVEAEAGNEDEDGKLLVANVVLNRVNSQDFPDSVTEVVFQQEGRVAQFSPVADGSYYKVVVSDETVRAVERALWGEDISQGALYFAARQYAADSQMKWFDECLTYLFAHGGHEFFK